jgi:hypothetical protein
MGQQWGRRRVEDQPDGEHQGRANRRSFHSRRNQAAPPAASSEPNADAGRRRAQINPNVISTQPDSASAATANAELANA